MIVPNGAASSGIDRLGGGTRPMALTIQMGRVGAHCQGVGPPYGLPLRARSK
jgi:hypothetical protein